ncbi:carboxymuconolactone decarboxylase family protein [Chloroflexota bacterium]
MAKKWSKKQTELIRRHVEERQSMPTERMLKLIELDPEFFEHYLNFSAHPWKKGVLPPKIKEFIYIAIDASVTHLFEPGVRSHIRRALDQGATMEELLEVLELISVLGIHSCSIGVPVLAEEYEKWQAKKKK